MSGNVGDMRNDLWMQEILFMPNRNDLQEKKKQLQCNNYMDPKKNCIYINKSSWNMHT